MFIHLDCRSQYSFLRAVPSPEEIVRAATAEKMPAVALTDTNGLYAALPFYQAAREAGVKPILGAWLDTDAGPLLLLAADRDGYSRLCELITRRQLDSQNNEHSLSLELLHAHRSSLIALYAPEKNAAPAESARQLKDIFGDALYFAVHHFPASGRTNLRAAEKLGRELGVPLVATNRVHFLRPEEFLHHRVLNAVRTGSLLTRIALEEIADAEAYFKSADEMAGAFAGHPEALCATLEIAERANLTLELGKTIFPEFPVPAGETPFSYLWRLCFEGARVRYRPPRPEVLARLTHELTVIEKLHLAPYFLLVWDIVEEARRRGIPVVGRGSAASSIVAYCLRISRICPLRWGLYFERFLNEQRGDCPDIDLDICGARRDELLNYVYDRWGAAHVAMIGSFITMHARLAVREVAKVFGVSPGEVNHFTRRLPHRPVREILEAIRTLPECRNLPAHEEPWKTILAVALRLDDFPRHMGIHPCGTVIAARPLTELVPLERATKGIVVTQYDMNAIEALGLIKMDLLGQRGLTTMSLALANIERSTGARPDFDALPEGDAATTEMTAAGRTLGVFQIESPGLRTLLRAMRAKTLDDLCHAIAIIRPGASEYGAKETFLRRLRGQEEVRYPHPQLEPLLRDTLGVCIYQEQVMQIAQAIGSLSLAEADIVRRSRAKFSGQRERERLHAKFLKAAELLQLAGAVRDETWQMVEKFAGFAFCKAHAATYADLAYRMAYLKAHYPAEFLAAMASANAGFYHVSAYVEEAKRWGCEVRLPSVNRSAITYTTEPSADSRGVRAVRVGLMQVKGLRQETMEAILRARGQAGEFRSLEDFLRRVPANRDETEALIQCGAMDDFGETRPALLWQFNLLAKTFLRSPESREAVLFPVAAPQKNSVPLSTADYTRAQRLACEQEILEIAVSGHPLDRVARNGEAWSTELEALRSRRVSLLGWLITFRHVGTKNYRNMMFATFEDQRGVYEAVLFPEAYERYGGLVFETRTMRVSGRVEEEGLIHCDKLERVSS
ncbi:MAG TPA: DNA polymerase III subunit alpha [Candidatus Acidoferrales bacterium]|nr:DNA polymerase III subunit alpha [Candidatus Acidoferrales bacterium]